MSRCSIQYSNVIPTFDLLGPVQIILQTYVLVPKLLGSIPYHLVTR